METSKTNERQAELVFPKSCNITIFHSRSFFVFLSALNWLFGVQQRPWRRFSLPAFHSAWRAFKICYPFDFYTLTDSVSISLFFLNDYNEYKNS